MDVLLVDFRGTAELLGQRAHVERDCLFVPEPDPTPEALLDILLRVRAPHGEIADIRARVLHVYEGAGVALELVDPPTARRVFEVWFEAASRCAPSTEPTRIGWYQEEPAASPSSPGYDAPPAACATEEPAADDAAEPAATDGDPPEPASSGEVDEIRRRCRPIQRCRPSSACTCRPWRPRRPTDLVKDPTMIQTFLQNKHITIEEVRYCGSRQFPDALQTIAANRDCAEPGLITALVGNPKTPQAPPSVCSIAFRRPSRLARSGIVPRASRRPRARR